MLEFLNAAIMFGRLWAFIRLQPDVLKPSNNCLSPTKRPALGYLYFREMFHF